MIVGLPGCGKTSWALNMCKTQSDKKYYIIGTDALIDKMRVMGLPRKRFFHGRWDVLIQKATGCLNKLFQIGELVCFLKLNFFAREAGYIFCKRNVFLLVVYCG